jgi:hypothetical protein
LQVIVLSSGNARYQPRHSPNQTRQLDKPKIRWFRSSLVELVQIWQCGEPRVKFVVESVQFFDVELRKPVVIRFDDKMPNVGGLTVSSTEVTSPPFDFVEWQSASTAKASQFDSLIGNKNRIAKCANRDENTEKQESDGRHHLKKFGIPKAEKDSAPNSNSKKESCCDENNTQNPLR